MNTKITYGMGRQYYADGATPMNPMGYVSKSILWDCFQERSPYSWKHGATKESSPAMVFGNLVHTLALTPQNFRSEFAVSEFDSFRTNAAKDWKAEQESSGKMVISLNDYNRGEEIAEIVCPKIGAFIGDANFEVAIHSEMPTRVKGMIDIVPRVGNMLADLKTTASIPSEKDMARLVLNRGYHWQAAMYLDLWNAASESKRDSFAFLFIETAKPYETAWVTLDEELIEVGRNEYRHALNMWMDCIKTNVWRKRIEDVLVVTVPAWYGK